MPSRIHFSSSIITKSICKALHLDANSRKVLNCTFIIPSISASEVIKSFQLESLKNKKDMLIKKLSGANTNEERESIAIELNEVNNKLGQLMIR